MKQFVNKLVCFVAVLIIIVIFIDAISFTDPGDILLGKMFFCTGYRHMGTSEIIPRIDKVSQTDEYTKLIVGDSVCNQLFGDLQKFNDDYCIASSNQAIGMAGQYLLIREFLENHSEANEVYLILVPGSLATDCASHLSYNYLVAPFGICEKLQHLDSSSINMINNVYGEIFTCPTIIRLVNGSSINNKLFMNYCEKHIFDGIDLTSSEALSNESVMYLEKINRICEVNQVKIYFLPGPIADTKDNRERVNNIWDKVDELKISNLYADYLQGIVYYDSIMFSDGTHFGGEYVDPKVFNECIRQLQEEYDCFSGLSTN